MALKGNHRLFLKLIAQGVAPRALVLQPLESIAELPWMFVAQAQEPAEVSPRAPADSSKGAKLSSSLASPRGDARTGRGCQSSSRRWTLPGHSSSTRPSEEQAALGWAPSLPGLRLVGSEQHWPPGIVCWELWVAFPKASLSHVLIQEFEACAYVLVCVELLLAKEYWWCGWQGCWYHFCKVLYLHLRWKLTTCSVHTHHLKRSPAENSPLLLSHKMTKTPAHAFSFKYSLSSPCIIQRNVILWRVQLFNWLH